MSSSNQIHAQKNMKGTCLFDSMKRMKNNKTPGNDGLTRNFPNVAGWTENKFPNGKYWSSFLKLNLKHYTKSICLQDHWE